MGKSPLLLLAMLALVGCAQARPAADLASDPDFLRQALRSGAMQIELSRLAAERAGSAEVRLFASEVIEQHRELDSRLAQIARVVNVPVRRGLDAPQQAEAARLANQRGLLFDRSYMTRMAAAQEENISNFEEESRSGASPAIRRFASAALPALREQLESAQDLAGRLGSNRL